MIAFSGDGLLALSYHTLTATHGALVTYFVYLFTDSIGKYNSDPLMLRHVILCCVCASVDVP